MPLGLSGVTGTSGDTGWDDGSKDPDKVRMNTSGKVAFRNQYISKLIYWTIIQSVRGKTRKNGTVCTPLHGIHCMLVRLGSKF